jgi:hypothetical protein
MSYPASTVIGAVDEEGKMGVTTELGPDVEQAGDRSPVERAVVEGRDPGWEELLALADRVGPSAALASLDDRTVVEQVRTGAARIAAEMCHWLDLVAELVIRRIWVDQGAKTPAVWLSWAVGLSPSAARDQVRVALRLRELGRVREEFAAGRLSYSKVRAITRVAVPELEELLLEWAGCATGADMERIVAGFRAAQRGGHRTPATDEWLRDVMVRDRADGTSEVVIRLPSEEAHALAAAADRLVDLDEADVEVDDEAGLDADGSDAAEAAGTGSCVSGDSAEATVQRPRGARRADAVLHALQAAVAAGGSDTTGADRHTLVIHADADDLADTSAGAQDETVAVDTARGHLPALSRRVLRRLACDAAIVPVALDGGGTPMDVGRRDRRLSTALRRALLARDRSCRFPGCGARRHLHGHHIWYWSDGGPTDLANLVLLCSFHHRYVHDHDVDIRLRPDRAHEFRHPDGRRIPRNRPLPEAGPHVMPAAPGHDPRGLEPDHWDGRHCLDTTVAVLQQQVRLVLPEADTTLAA